MSILIKKVNNQFIFYDKEIGINIEEWFLRENFEDETKPNTKLIHNKKWIKKHYVRKGLMAFLGDLYLNSSIQHTRSYLEFSLLNDLYKKGFPTCKPIIGWVKKSKFTYTANLITEYIPSVNLKTYITQNKMKEKDWYLIGALIANLHKHNVFHGDLNITNILVNEDDKRIEKFLLIDFDKSELKKYLTVKSKESNLDRILRSLKKNNLFNKISFNKLIEGYSFTSD